MFGKSKASKTGAWANGRAKSKTNERNNASNPLLKSSLEYEEFLQARLYPRVTGSSHSIRRPQHQVAAEEALPPAYEDSSHNIMISGRAQTNTRIRTAPPRPAWVRSKADTRNTKEEKEDWRRSEMEMKGEHSPNSLRSKQTHLQGEGDEEPVLRHSWRRHVTPDRVHESQANLNLTTVPRNPSDVAALMAAAHESMEMSRQREEIINGLLREGSRGERERVCEQEQQKQVSISGDEEEPFRIMKVRNHVLSRTWNQFRKATQASRKREIQHADQIQLNCRQALQRRYLQNWRATTRANFAENHLKSRRMKDALGRWSKALEMKHRNSEQLFAAEAIYRETHQTQVLSSLRTLTDDKRDQEIAAERERTSEAVAVAVHRRQLLRSAFSGFQSSIRVDAGQRELDEESSRRRMRIAALVSTLGNKSQGLSYEAEEKASKSEKQKRNEQKSPSTRVSRGTNRLTVSPRRLQAKGRDDRPQISPRGLVLPLGVSTNAESKEDQFEYAPKEDTKHIPRRDNRVSQDAKRTPSTGSKYLAKSEPTSANLRNRKLESKESFNSHQQKTTSGPRKTAENTLLSQDDIDRRAQERRQRQAELSAGVRNRLAKTRQAEEHRAQEEKNMEDQRFELQQDEYRRNMLTNKNTIDERARQEAELRRKLKLALEHRSKSLIIRWGFGPWQRLMVEDRLKWARAMNYYDDSLLQQSWIALYGYCMSVRTERARREYRQSSMAVVHYRRGLIQEMWQRWKLNKRLIRAKAKAVTGHFSRFTVNRRAFGAWRVALERQRRWEVQRTRDVLPLGQRAVKRYFWGRWLMYYREALVEREISSRSNLTWQKVQSWLD